MPYICVELQSGKYIFYYIIVPTTIVWGGIYVIIVSVIDKER